MRTLRLLPVLVLAATVGARAQFEVYNFSQARERVQAIGSTIIQGSLAVLTPAAGAQAGGLWYREKQSVADGFSTQFSFRMSQTGGASDENGNPGADGFAFVVQNSSIAALGGTGHRLGYEGIPNSVAVEFDTWYNPAQGCDDPNGMHVSVQTRGVAPNSVNHRYSLGVATDIPNLEDGSAHTARIDYRDQTLRVWIDAAREPAITAKIDLAKLLRLDAGRAWVGFTGASAAAWQQIELTRWTFGDVEPGTVGRGTIR